MRSAIRFLSVGALALMLAQLGVAQSQGSSTQGSSTSSASGQDTSSQGSSTQSAGTDGQYMPEKTSKNAPSPSTMDNIDAIGNPNVGCKEGVGNWYSLEKQVAMGRSYSQQVEHGAKMVSDPLVTEYVNRVGQNLVRNS